MSSRKEHVDGPRQPFLPGMATAARVARAKKMATHRLPTNTTTRVHPIHRWFNFIAGFSPEFVINCCDQAGLTTGDSLLDPFTGCATAPLAACELGLTAYGFEPHPIFYRIAKAKLVGAGTSQAASAIEKIIANGLSKPASIDILEEAPRHFLQKLFAPESLSALLGAREFLLASGYKNDDLGFLILSRIVDKATHSQTDGIYKAPTSKKIALPPQEVCRKTVQMILDDLEAIGQNDYQSHARIYNHSSEQMSEIPTGSISAVVTSPPYLNNFDYAEMTRMLLYFWGIATSWNDITNKVRSSLITNTTTALRGQKERQAEYRDRVPAIVLNELDSLVTQLRNRKTERAGKKDYDFLVFPYFAQMTSVLSECRRCLKGGAPIHLMVADAALYGVHISAPQILAAILEDMGFANVKCEQVRKRGTRWILQKREGSKVGLGEYHISATR